MEDAGTPPKLFTPSIVGRPTPENGTAARARSNEIALRIPPGRVLRLLLLIIGWLVALGALLPAHVSWLGRESHVLAELALRLHLDGEGNVPSWFSALLMLACSIVLFVLAAESRRADGRWRLHWLALAIVFLYLSLDEAAQLHELLSIPARLWLTERTDGAVWVIPVLLLGLVCGLAYVPFLLALPGRIALLKIAAGLAFITGAMGVETISADLDKAGLAYHAWVVLEEGLEMTGIALYLHALLRLVEMREQSLRVAVGS